MTISNSYSLSRAVTWWYTQKELPWKMSKYLLSKRAGISFFNNAAGFRNATLLKQYSCTSASCEFWEMFQNTYSLENVQKAASGSPQWIIYVIKKAGVLNLFFAILLQPKILSKNTKKQSWYETCLIYSFIPLGFWYWIKSLSGYFSIKGICTKK